MNPSPATPCHSNRSLHHVLHEMNPPPTLDWNVCYNIAVGIAHELAYLHHDCDPPIVHQHINSNNILPDSEMKPHISDSGVALLSNQSSSPTSQPSTSSEEVQLEANTMEASIVSDVYNYGVVLLELITRKKLLDSSSQEKDALVRWARSVWSTKADITKIVDSSLARELSQSSAAIAQQAFKVLWVALLCSKTDPRKRPTMRTVIKLLEQPF